MELGIREALDMLVVLMFVLPICLEVPMCMKGKHVNIVCFYRFLHV